jgi:hypothetical protein
VFVTIHGNGSFSLGPNSRIWRGPRSYPITPEQAEEVIEYLRANTNASSWIEVTEYDPNLEPDEPLTGTLRPEDLAWNKPADVEPEPKSAPIIDPAGLPLDFACPHCPRAMPSEDSLARHVEFEHSNIHEENLAALQAAAQAERERQHEVTNLQDYREQRKDANLAPWDRELADPDRRGP